MGTYISPEDLTESLPSVGQARLLEAVEDAEAWAKIHAPGIKAPAFKADPDKMKAVKAILRKAIVYDLRSGSGTTTQQAAGPFSETVTAHGSSSTMFSDAQVAALRRLATPAAVQAGIYSLSLGHPYTPGAP